MQIILTKQLWQYKKTGNRKQEVKVVNRHFTVTPWAWSRSSKKTVYHWKPLGKTNKNHSGTTASLGASRVKGMKFPNPWLCQGSEHWGMGQGWRLMYCLPKTQWLKHWRLWDSDRFPASAWQPLPVSNCSSSGHSAPPSVPLRISCMWYIYMQPGKNTCTHKIKINKMCKSKQRNARISRV